MIFNQSRHFSFVHGNLSMLGEELLEQVEFALKFFSIVSGSATGKILEA